MPTTAERATRRDSTRPVATVAYLAASVLVGVGCLADLPPPAICPAPAERPATSCAAALDALERTPGSSGAGSCSAAAARAVACLPSTSCEACAVDVAGCYPAPACPEAVQRAAGAGGRCARIVSERESAPASCTPCMRDQCAALCDGRGPVFAFSDAATRGARLNLLQGDATPPAGAKVGIYARMRGNGTVSLNAHVGTRALIQESVTIASVDFTDFVTAGVAIFMGGVPYTFAVSALDQQGAIVEIDCIIPFWSGP